MNLHSCVLACAERWHFSAFIQISTSADCIQQPDWAGCSVHLCSCTHFEIETLLLTHKVDDYILIFSFLISVFHISHFFFSCFITTCMCLSLKTNMKMSGNIHPRDSLDYCDILFHKSGVVILRLSGSWWMKESVTVRPKARTKGRHFISPQGVYICVCATPSTPDFKFSYSCTLMMPCHVQLSGVCSGTSRHTCSYWIEAAS